VIPLYLTIAGFLSYRDPVEIDFSRFDLACISGQNGAGKSSLLDALTWVLFGQARKRDDSIINNQSTIAEVSLTGFCAAMHAARLPRSSSSCSNRLQAAKKVKTPGRRPGDR
jgi:DNA repair exonuclease SbcCD ATPase subunit